MRARGARAWSWPAGCRRARCERRRRSPAEAEPRRTVQRRVPHSQGPDAGPTRPSIGCSSTQVSARPPCAKCLARPAGTPAHVLLSAMSWGPVGRCPDTTLPSDTGHVTPASPPGRSGGEAVGACGELLVRLAARRPAERNGTPRPSFDPAVEPAVEPAKGSSLRCHRRCGTGQDAGSQVDMDLDAIPPRTCRNSGCDV